MIWLLLGYLFFGGSGLGPLQAALERVSDAIVEVVADDARRDTATAAIEGFRERVDADQERFATLGEEFVALIRDRGSSVGDFDAQFKAADALRFGVQKGLLDLRDGLHEQLTREEWGQVFPGPK